MSFQIYAVFDPDPSQSYTLTLSYTLTPSLLFVPKIGGESFEIKIELYLICNFNHLSTFCQKFNYYKLDVFVKHFYCLKSLGFVVPGAFSKYKKIICNFLIFVNLVNFFKQQNSIFIDFMCFFISGRYGYFLY